MHPDVLTLGALTLEQAEHLIAADAGALAGLTSLPSLRTWRQRLGELADGCDPLALQRRLASQMLAIEPAESQVYLADDHLAEYTGHQASPWAATRAAASRPRATTTPISVTWPAGRSRPPPASPRRCAPRCPARWRRSRRPPAGARPGPDTRPLIVFDRGAAFPSTFTEVDAAGYDWLTWRRAPLAATTLLPIAQTITLRGHRSARWPGPTSRSP